ncbi:exodeoxyribonuclease V subunit alpha [Paludibacterium paludis]|uniref:RecBCD enzyme subunit RecD n=1 Tax=Paludibacterium paludis TaxID=1225769 RepID=A0A918P5U5_9NEIS|nr:exodeoxyribonuclease V subunit alpha [Paludibacterium paludis]GGY27798.1 RecBCD enzyme subunit RecD [Paludibacterium paludis]
MDRADGNDSLAAQLNALFARLDPFWDEEAAGVVGRLLDANSAGHVCLPLTGPRDRARLACSPLTGRPGQYAPLVLDEAGRLYFARHWHDETLLAERLGAMARVTVGVDDEALATALAGLFPGEERVPDRQKLAAALAARRRLMVISGGPGTGKTTTVVRLLALLAGLPGRPLSMAMAAPTGKAAARLAESVNASIAKMPLDEDTRRQLPRTASTLHRLLGVRPGEARARHHAGNPLPLDVLVVDEASMIDQSLMARTVEALPSGCRLILLGDRDQLSSVDAGAVLGDLCGRIEFREETLAWLAEVAGPLPDDLAVGDGPLADCVMLLTHSHRFAAGGGIGELARRVNAGDAQGALAALDDPASGDIGWCGSDLIFAAYDKRRDYLAEARRGSDPAAIQRAFQSFMLLAAERRQIEAVNQGIERLLEQEGVKPAGRDGYAGRPVMVTENDYGIQLFNGDIGFTVERSDGLRVLFPDASGGWREIAPGRLPAHQTVYAMTVHKSQGSEYGDVWLALPDTPTPSLDRALIYTAITRARESFRVHGGAPVWLAGVSVRTWRDSALAERLRG